MTNIEEGSELSVKDIHQLRREIVQIPGSRPISMFNTEGKKKKKRKKKSSTNDSIDEILKSKIIDNEKVKNDSEYSIKEIVMHRDGYPIRAVDPKVWVPHKKPPNGIPRKIVIERKRREYNSKNIENLLLDEGINFQKSEGSGNKNEKNSFENYLPLEAFDDTEFDSRTPEEWIKLGEVKNVSTNEKKMFYVPAITVLFDDMGKGQWKSCKVLKFDKNSHTFLITISETNEKIWQPRIFILFKAEDPEIFAKRMSSAFKSRKEAESLLRYNLYVDNMPNDEIPPLPKTKVQRMKKMSLASNKLMKIIHKLSIDELLQEVIISYERTMNKIVFDKNMKDESQKELFSFLKIPDEPIKEPCPFYALIKLPKYNFKENFKNFQFNTFLSERCVIKTLLSVKKENLAKEEIRMFNLPLKKITQIEDFKTLQHQSIERNVHHLEEIWKLNVVKTITRHFKECKKGWLNIFEKKVTIYNMSKLKRFMNTVRFMMEDTLRFMMEDTLKEFVEFLKDVNRFKVDVISPVEVKNELKVETVEFCRQIFTIELTQKDGKFTYNTSVNLYPTIMIELFDRILNDLRNIFNVEPYVMKNLYWNWNKIKKLITIQHSEEFPHVIQWRITAEKEISEAVEPLNQYILLYDRYIPLLERNNEEYAALYEREDHKIDDIKKEIQKHLKEQKDIVKSVPHKINVGTFVVDCQKVKNYLSKKCQGQADLILEILNKKGKTKVSIIMSSFGKLQRELNKTATNIQVLCKLREFIFQLPGKIEKLQHEINEMKDVYDLLELFRKKIGDDEFKQKCLAISWPKKINEQKERVETHLVKLEEEFRDRMEGNKEEYKNKLDRIDAEVAEFAKRTDFNKVKENAKDIKATLNEIKRCQQEASEFQEKEILFKTEVTQYSQLRNIQSNIRPFADLWLTAYDWINWQDSWMNDPFDKLDAQKMEDDVKGADRKIAKCCIEFQQNPAILNIAQEIRDRIRGFKPNLPLIIALRNPGIRPRHWASISKEIGIELVVGETIKTLNDVLDLGLGDHLESIQKISEIGGKEYTIEKALTTMKELWDKTNFNVIPYKNTGTYVLKISDEFQQQLDDHIALTQTISFSAFKGEFEKVIDEWNDQLILISEIVDEWLSCQREWMALEPIFSSAELIKQLPNLYKKFKIVDVKYRKSMENVHHSPSVLSFCSSKKVLETFKSNNSILSTVQKGLFNYLETKRKQFARLYFLADDELLTILAKAKEPRTIQPYLKKCFSNINKVTFEDDDEISWMHSKDGEKIKFVEGINPVGSVEVWLKLVEFQMMVSVKKELHESLIEYGKIERNKWILRWPGQIIMVGSQIAWTKDVSEVLNKEGNKGLKKYHKTMCQDIENVSKILIGNVTNLERLKLSSLLTIDVHSRDVVERMHVEGVNSITDFQWISQLRYYWEECARPSKMSTTQDLISDELNFECVVRQVEARFIYGYEYLGNTTRLVITPLTDRIYLTLTGALKMILGGSPAGPAGTGKTETVKDLAKAVAKQCVVFNCSEGLNEFAMGKFFKGLIMSGAWACFDEFNRIDIEVLSVVAQQITTLQEAIRAGKREVEFENTTVFVDPTFAVFITMNPGYAGRTELPDNLSALFRPVACMIPDYALIAEIRLFSFGFGNARTLSKKMVATFKLSSEQLSSQDHYDFGMRALNTVIDAAGALKRKDPSMDEDVLLLRALIDSNVPKFLQNDVILFNGIIKDLFPEVIMPDANYGDMMTHLKLSAEKLGLDPNPSFIAKCIQLHETIILRHGLMIVGLTGSGKTSNYRVLSNAITELSKIKKDEEKYKPVKISTINPKAVTMSQLYGEYDRNTREWRDGVLANEFKKLASEESDTKKWLIFDGPVDALWIESMNTVLDDNRKLCLVSGAIIELSSSMNIIFEVQDLAVASPATVSRCGMVYMNHTNVPLKSRMICWMKSLPEKLPVLKDYVDQIEKTSSELLAKSVSFMMKSKNIEVYIPKTRCNFISSFYNLFECLMKPYAVSREELLMKSEKEKEAHEEKLKNLGNVINPLILFSIIWSVGGTCDLNGRKLFDAFIKGLFIELNIKNFPEDGLVYDYQYDQEQNVWVQWINTQPKFVLDPSIKFKDIIVPTTDTIRYKWLLETYLLNGKHTLCVGPTGTGKSLIITESILNLGEKYIPSFIFFSARTTSNQTQDIMDSKIERRRKGVYGPTAGKTNMFFVDDLNMPQKEKYGAQPPIELLRQWMDYKGWYEYKSEKLLFRKVIDTTFVCAMGPPGGGRTSLTERFTRHFNVVSFPEMEDNTIFTIFHTILKSWMDFTVNEKLRFVSTPLVESSIDLYNSVRKTMLPTPSKSHYTFNLRDIAKVFQGILDVNTSSLQKISDVLRLWIHECRRVFKDRLVNSEDGGAFETILKEQLEKSFKVPWEEVVNPEVRLLYGDYMSGGVGKKSYEEVKSMKDLVKSMVEQLEYYNSTSEKQMNLVLFLDAIEHVSRISRIIRQKGGHSLLLGVGGSGRRSLTKLAAFMADFKLFEVEINKGYTVKDWRDFLKSMMMCAGVEDNEIVFLFCDSDILNESFLEDINNMLNSGDVPNMYEPQDLEEIYTVLKKVCAIERLPMNPSSWFSRYVKRVRHNLHIVLAMSPGGEKFRNRLRMFPSLVNCCTIDWFSSWPLDALLSVAKEKLSEMDLGDYAENVLKMFGYLHRSVSKASKDYFEVSGRYNYVTPTSYLELLASFKKLFVEERKTIEKEKKKFETGLETLRKTEIEVARLEKVLTEKKPILIQTQKKIEDNMEKIKKDKEQADKTMEIISRQEKEAEEREKECREIAESAQRELNKALPALEEALKDLNNLEVKDVKEVAGYLKPTKGILLTVTAVCVMLGIKPKPVTKMGKVTKDYWEPAKELLKTGKDAIRRMVQYDKNNIPPKKIKQIQKFIDDDEFTIERISKASSAATAMCQFVRAMYNYYFVSKEVEPLRQKLKGAKIELNKVIEQLNEARDQLSKIEAKIQQLNEENAKTVKKQKELAEEVEVCNTKLTRAQKLIDGLADEKKRWVVKLEYLQGRDDNIIGDIVISAGSMAYFGSFTFDFREKLKKEWLDELTRLKVPVSEKTDITELIEPVVIREWTQEGLPFDKLSIQNAVILSKSRRFPLFIDPQMQANKWIKNKEKANGLKVINLNQKDYMRSLLNAVQFGSPVLLENIGESIHPEMEPILLKQTTVKGGILYIKIGDDDVPYSSDFRLYITTKLRNPHYSPELSAKVTLLNFFITPEGLEDQLLGTVVTLERPELEQMKVDLMMKNVKLTNQLIEIQNSILQLLEENKDDILGSESLIIALGKSKVASTEIKVKLEESETTKKEIDLTRNKYHKVAFRGSLLFFCISDMANVDPMYQYSLQWFIDLFKFSIDNADESEDLDKRLENLIDYFTYLLYHNVCQSLFERHKLLFSFLLTIRIIQGDDNLDKYEWRYFLTGTSKKSFSKPKPKNVEWITEKIWNEVQSISGLDYFGKEFIDSFENEEMLKKWEKCFQSDEVDTKIPYKDNKFSNFQQLMILRCLRPDKVTEKIFQFITINMGKKFVTPPRFDLLKSFKNSNNITPLVFVLSSGADPKRELDKFATTMRIKRFDSVSLGRGTEKQATKVLQQAMVSGSWVLLQNCHLATSFMDSLEQIVDGFDPEENNRDFRLWLTSKPTKSFPVSILQNSVKMTFEPPKGLKANLMRSYDDFNDDLLIHEKKPDVFKKLLFSLCFFHAVVQERKKYGPLGWNVSYSFTTGDLEICMRQLRLFLENYSEVPYKIIKYLFGEINYGGRVTDFWDRRTIMTIVQRYLNESVLNDGYLFGEMKEYFSPPVGNYSAYMRYLDSLPSISEPSVVGLHKNAEISYNSAEMGILIKTILGTRPKGSSSGGDEMSIIQENARQMLEKIKDPFDIEFVKNKFPTKHLESMNTVIVQEVLRYNKLLSVIKKSLSDVIEAVKGLVVMSTELETMGQSIFNNQVPETWKQFAYPSEMPLGDWVLNLVTRITFIDDWINNGTPKAYWISGFYFPQGFLTGILQNYARRNNTAIDRISFDFEIMDETSPSNLPDVDEGCYIYGLFLEGARFDKKLKMLQESKPKILFEKMPIILLKPTIDRAVPKTGIYISPLYKTLRRAGKLSTTGHSTNYVVEIELPSNKEQKYWINRGVALVCALKYNVEVEFK